jgi:hypothetical protein
VYGCCDAIEAVYIYWSYGGVFITEMDDDVMFVMVSKPMTLVYNHD